VLCTLFVAFRGSDPELFDNREIGVLLDLQRKSRTSHNSVSILGFVEELIETKLSIVFRIPSITSKNTCKT
jgi:hypothetical protein